jgi:hypothetical protein
MLRSSGVKTKSDDELDDCCDAFPLNPNLLAARLSLFIGRQGNVVVTNRGECSSHDRVPAKCSQYALTTAAAVNGRLSALQQRLRLLLFGSVSGKASWMSRRESLFRSNV